jgi:predicted nucleic acid-binding protein
MLVVDASFAIEASLTANGLDRLDGRGAVAPPLLWSEVTSVLHEMQWRKAISSELATQARHRFARVSIAKGNPARLTAHAWAIADQFGWAKTYDAEYVALAQTLKCPLLTVDARLARAAGGIVAILSPSEL